MSYEINVALNGRHYFATDKRSLLTHTEGRELLAVLTDKFPPSEGYKLTLKRVETRYELIDEVA
jgi:hypothetical protein